MPKHPQDHLYRLVHSLSKSEKQYFSLFMSRNRESAPFYIQLFDCLLSIKKYDESLVLKKLKGATTSNRLSDQKNYLFNLILLSIEEQNHKIDDNDKLRRGIIHSEILFHKNIPEAALKIVKKSINLAQSLERFIPLLELLSLEKRILFRLLPAEKYFSEATRIAADEMKALKQYQNLLEYAQLASRMSYLSRIQGASRTDEESLQMKSVILNPLMQDVNRALSFNAKVHYYRVNSVYCSHNGNYNGSLKFSGELVALFENNPIHQKDKPNLYAGALYNLAIAYELLKKWDELMILVKKIKQVKFSSKTLATEAHVLATMMELTYYAFNGLFKEVKDLIPAFIAFYEQNESHISTDDKQVINANFAELYFGVGNQKMAKKYLNNILNTTEAKMERNDLYSTAMIVNIIFSFESGDWDDVARNLRSAYLYFHRKKRTYAFEEVVLNFLKKLLRIKTKEEFIRELIATRNSLEELKQNPYEYPAIHLFPFIPWLNSKIEKIPYTKAVREYAEKTNKLETSKK